MAKSQINTKSRSYMRDKEAFLKDLKQFNESKNITVKPPIVNGVEIDLYLFYTLVQQRGGIGKVNQNDVWESFMRPLRLPHPCINGSTLLRRIYGIHLEKYERAKGPPGRDDDMELDEDPRRGRGSNMPRITFSGGTYISASGEALRTATKPSPAPSERLALSLLSPMPNEQDFAVNVCTVLAADHSNRLPLSTTPHILDFLLAHAGVYNHSSLRETIGRSYFEARGRYPDDFWRLRAGGGGARELADETKFMQIGVEQPELMVQAMAAHNNLTDCLMRDGSDDEGSEKAIGELQDILEDWVTEPSEESSLFAPELAGGASCVYTQRVLQVASIVRSLSFHEDNVHYLARNTTLIRFLLLCANCWVGTLRQSGLDTLGNISTELIIKDPATCLISRHILSTIQSALVSPDRARVLAALELLNKLSQNEANEDALLKALESKVYHDVCALLTLRDIMVLVCTLECVYALTSLGERASEAVAREPGLVHTLVSLVTVEAQSYGPRACILMRVVETVSGPAALAAVAEQQQQPHAQPQPVQVQAKQAAEPAPPAAPSPAPPATPAPVNSLQQSHMHQKTVQENENFALAWLRSSFEPLPPQDNSTFDAAELYRQYLACCGKLARKGVIAPQHFPRLVRTVFGGTVGPNNVMSSGETQQVYVGIRSRNPQNRANPTPASPASPILKAQLTSKAAADAKSVPSQQQPQTPSHPHLSQALESNPTNTTLIKHLLAHKVAQRQQNQQRVPSTSNTVVVQSASQAMEVDPEAMIKCTAITPGGVASITPAVQEKVIVNAPEELLVCKEEPVQIQIDEQSQLTIKTTQNKMLADLLEKKSNPPVQVVQMGSSINAPTIQITETGQIVQVKSESTPVIQINEAGMLTQGNQFFQIKNEQGQLIQIKNDQGQIIQLKTDQLQQPMLQFKNDQIVIKPEGQMGQIGQLLQGQVGQIIQNVKVEKDLVEHVITDHSYTEPPSKKIKLEDKKEIAPQESVSKTAANLYAALAASALEDEEDLLPPPKQETVDVMQQSLLDGSMVIQEPILQVQQPTMQVQQPTLQVQQPTLQVQGNTIQVQPSTMQVQQPMLQVQPMDVQNIIASQSGQIILQEKTISSQPQFVQQPMQIIATPSTSQGGLSYITQNIPTNMMQKTIIIVQGTGGGPLTLTVNNPGGLDEATLNSLIAQATEAITQQQIIQNTGLIQSTQRVIMTPTLVSTSQPTVSNTGLIQSSQRVIMGQPGLVSSSQPTSSNTGIIQSTQRVLMAPQPTFVSVSQPTSNSGIIQSTQRVMMPQTTIVSSSQGLTSNSGIIQSSQRVIMSPQPALGSTSQLAIASSTPQITPSQQPLITTQPQPHKAQIVNQSQQIVVTNKNPPALISTSSNNQQGIVSSNQQMMNSPMKTAGHRVVQPQRSQVINVQNQPVQENKPTVKAQQPMIRQVITRQPIMVGNTKIGDKETVVNQPVVEQKPVSAPAPSPVTPVVKPTPSATPPLQPTPQEDTPWICHWRGCGKAFPNASEVFSHCARVHCPGGAAGEAPCLWAECDRVPRRTFALLNHLTDKHCSPQALKAMYNSRRQQAAEAEANKPVTLGYPPNAALAALNKHAQDMFNPRELMDENEGPVTKSIRLTAALILRNIVIYSNTGRRQLRSYEAHLACIALSSVEASRTIAQVLYDMNNI